MGVATTVGKVDVTALQWLQIEDDSGRVYLYKKGKEAALNAQVHVHCDYSSWPAIRAVLVRDNDGNVFLQQEEPGLPKQIVVNYFTKSPAPGAPFLSGWESKLEYDGEV
jgi:hypothetical protein